MSPATFSEIPEVIFLYKCYYVIYLTSYGTSTIFQMYHIPLSRFAHFVKDKDRLFSALKQTMLPENDEIITRITVEKSTIFFLNREYFQKFHYTTELKIVIFS